jgi:hypothetical protein
MTCERQALNPVQKHDQELNHSDKLRADTVHGAIKSTLVHFDALDQDKDGFLTVPELQNMADKKVGGALAKRIDAIQSLSNDEWFFENDGITREDLATLDHMSLNMAKDMAMARDIRETGERNFYALKGDDSKITKIELTNAAHSNNFSTCDSEALKNAVNNFVSIGHKPTKFSRKISAPHFKEFEGEVKERFTLVDTLASDLNK